MKQKVKDIVQKINFLETDLELQKQILFSIPTGKEDEMKESVEKIAALKNQISDLRASIRDVDPEEYERIIAYEKAAERFKQITSDKKIKSVVTLDHNGECRVTLNDDSVIECLVIAEDDNGDLVALTMDGRTMELSAGEVKEFSQMKAVN